MIIGFRWCIWKSCGLVSRCLICFKHIRDLIYSEIYPYTFESVPNWKHTKISNLICALLLLYSFLLVWGRRLSRRTIFKNKKKTSLPICSKNKHLRSKPCNYRDSLDLRHFLNGFPGSNMPAKCFSPRCLGQIFLVGSPLIEYRFSAPDTIPRFYLLPVEFAYCPTSRNSHGHILRIVSDPGSTFRCI